MTEGSKKAAVVQYPSDSLADDELFGLLMPAGVWMNFLRVPKLLVVADANVVVQAAVHRAKLSNPNNRTTIEELRASTSVTFVAPPVLRDEVRRAIPRDFPKYAAVALPEAERLFELLHFVEVPEDSRSKGGKFEVLANRDSDDLEYAWVLEFTGADFILTADTHFANTGFDVVRVGDRRQPDRMIELRDWVRDVADGKGRTRTLSIGGALVVEGVRALTRVDWRLLLGIGAAGLAVWALLPDQYRDGARRKAAELGREFVGVLMEEAAELGNAQARNAERKAALADIFQRRALNEADAVFRCVVDKPGTPAELATLIQYRFARILGAAQVEQLARTDARLMFAKGRVDLAAPHFQRPPLPHVSGPARPFSPELRKGIVPTETLSK